MIYLEDSGDNFNDILSFTASELQTLNARVCACVRVCACTHVDGRISDVASDLRLIPSLGCVEHKQTIVPHTH